MNKQNNDLDNLANIEINEPSLDEEYQTKIHTLYNVKYDKRGNEMINYNDIKWDNVGDYFKKVFNIKKIDEVLYFHYNGKQAIQAQTQMGWIGKILIQASPELTGRVLKKIEQHFKDEEDDLYNVYDISFKNKSITIFYNEETKQWKTKDIKEDKFIPGRINYNFNQNITKSDTKWIEDVLLNWVGNEESKKDLLAFIGSLLTNSRTNVITIFEGDKANNGKTTCAQMIGNLLKDSYIFKNDVGEMLEGFGKAELLGKKLVVIDDIESRYLKETSALKSIVTSDLIHANRKGLPFQQFKNQTNWIFTTERMPLTATTSHGWLRRLLLINFDNTFEKRDHKFIKQLMSDETMEALISISLARYIEYLNSDKPFHLWISVTSQILKEEYEIENNPILQYYKEKDKDYFLSRSTNEIFLDFKIWLEQNGEVWYGTKINFSRELNKIGLRVFRTTKWNNEEQKREHVQFYSIE